MVYSDFESNWDRLEILARQAYSYYKMTAGTVYRDCNNYIDGKFVLNIEKEEFMDKEKSIVSMLIAWVEITIESLVNQIIAEKTSNIMLATFAIENPRQLVDRFSVTKKPKSELGCKLIILTNNKMSDASLIDIADDMATKRNRVIHDKPIYIGPNDEEESYFVYSSKVTEPFSYKYNELNKLFKYYDILLKFLLDKYADQIAIFKREKIISLENILRSNEEDVEQSLQLDSAP